MYKYCIYFCLSAAISPPTFCDLSLLWRWLQPLYVELLCCAQQTVGGKMQLKISHFELHDFSFWEKRNHVYCAIPKIVHCKSLFWSRFEKERQVETFYQPKKKSTNNFSKWTLVTWIKIHKSAQSLQYLRADNKNTMCSTGLLCQPAH